MTLTRGTTALLVFASILAVLLSGLWSVKQATDAMSLQAEARKSTLAMLERRLSMPAPARDVKLDEASFVQGANYALAANALQQHIVHDSEDNGARIVSSSIDPEDTSQPPSARAVVVQVVFDISNDGLQRVLYQLEAGLPFISIESLKVAPARDELQATAASTAGDRLHVDLQALGYFRGKK